MTPSDLIYSSKGWKILSRAYDNERVSSTYLFYGPDGVGRWQSAVSLAALLNCEDVQKISNESGANLTTPCGKCRNCLNIFNLSFQILRGLALLIGLCGQLLLFFLFLLPLIFFHLANMNKFII